MGDLYLIFFAFGLLVFGGIVAYSILQKRHFKPVEKKDYVDPLFAELEESKKPLDKKADQKSSSGTGSADGSSSADGSRSANGSSPIQAKPKKNKGVMSDAHTGSTVSEAKELREPSLTEPSSEPSLTDEGQDSVRQVESSKTRNAPSLNDEVQEPSVDEPRSATVHKAELAPKPRLDKDSSSVVTDLVARIKNREAIEQQGLLSLFRKHDFKFHRKVHIYGLNQLTDMWRDIEFELPSARFTELGVSIQLADREGAMSQKELHDFQQMVLEFTNFYDAPFEFSMEIDEALKQALALDQIGRRYDSMAVLNVVPKTKAGFRMADIESCARDLMMSTDKNDIFMKTLGTKNNISVLFRLACTDGSGQFGISSGASTPVHDLVVYMNVPATKDPEMVFQEMVKDANSLATWLEGKVVDRNGRVMTQRSYSMLMQQVSDIAFSMQQDGFTPGDAVAKKLF